MTKLYMIIISLLMISQQSQAQSIKGIVKDESSLLPLPGASVKIIELNRGGYTSADGTFILENIPIGRYTLSFSHIGYAETIISEILITSGKEQFIEAYMKENIFYINQIVVKPSISKERAGNNMAAVSSRRFSVEEALRYAGGMDDPGRIVSAFAGVVSAGLSNNAIIVRGNAPKGLIWRLEGTDIPRPNHFSESNVAGGGGITIFSAQMLSNSDFYTGAFPAEFSNGYSGVFDLKFRNGNTSKRENSIQIGVQGVSVSTEGPLNKNFSASYLVNYRYSTMGLIFSLLPETKDGGEKPIYQDLAYKIHLPIKKLGNLSLWGIGGLSSSTMKGSNDTLKWMYQEDRKLMDFDYDMGAAGASLTSRLGNNSTITNVLSYNLSSHKYKEDYREIDENRHIYISPVHNISIKQHSLIISSLINIKQSGKTSIKGGLTFTLLSHNLYGKAAKGDNFVNFLNGKGSTCMTNIHTQIKHTLSQKFEISAGFNISHFMINREILLEPRASIEYNITPAHTLTLGYGLHSQSEQLFIYFIQREEDGQSTYPNKKLKKAKSNHLVLAYNWHINKNLHFKAEPYIQFLYDVPVVNNSPISMINFKNEWTFNQPLINSGSGKNVGIDLSLERFMKNGLYYIATASLYRSRYKGGDNIERRSRFDGGYVINYLLGKEVRIGTNKILSINFRTTISGPQWYQPVDEIQTAKLGEVIYDQSQPFNFRESNIETASDATITYRVNHARSSSTIAIQLKNLIGKEYIGKKYNLITKKTENDYFKSVVPFISYKIEF